MVDNTTIAAAVAAQNEEELGVAEIKGITTLFELTIRIVPT